MATMASIEGGKVNGVKWKHNISLPIKSVEDKIDEITDHVERIKFVESKAKAIVKRLERLKSGTHDDDLKNWIDEFSERFIYPDDHEITDDIDEFNYIKDEFICYLNELFNLFDYHRICVKCI